MVRVGLTWHGLEGRLLATSTPAILPANRENGAADRSRTCLVLLTMEALSHESSDGQSRSQFPRMEDWRCARLESNQHLCVFSAALPPGQLRARDETRDERSRRVESNHPGPEYETGALPRERRRQSETDHGPTEATPPFGDKRLSPSPTHRVDGTRSQCRVIDSTNGRGSLKSREVVRPRVSRGPKCRRPPGFPEAAFYHIERCVNSPPWRASNRRKPGPEPGPEAADRRAGEGPDPEGPRRELLCGEEDHDRGIH